MSMFRAFICHGLNTNNLTTWLHSVIYELRKEHYNPNSFIGPGSYQRKYFTWKSFSRKKVLSSIFSTICKKYKGCQVSLRLDYPVKVRYEIGSSLCSVTRQPLYFILNSFYDSQEKSKMVMNNFSQRYFRWINYDSVSPPI